MSRGFLPRGLSNTCPQVCATRSAVASHGQVSNKPKHKLTSGSRLATCCESPFEVNTQAFSDRLVLDRCHEFDASRS